VKREAGEVVDIFDAIRIPGIPRVWITRGLSTEQIQSIHRNLEEFGEAENLVVSSETYRHFTVDEGRSIAVAALELFDAGANSNEYIPHQILTNLANVVPGSLQGLYPSLLERDLGWGSDSMFREADWATRDRIISLLDAQVQSIYTRQDLLCALAWIGDDVVQRQFYQWHQTPPMWRNLLYTPPEEYANAAGWELTEEGTRRNLFFEMCYDLVVPEQAPLEDTPGPVSVAIINEERCGWCGHPLTTLFDIDLRDPRMAFLPIQGKRLRIAQCLNCALQVMPHPVTDIDGDGTSRWSLYNTDPPKNLKVYDENDTSYESLPPNQWVLGMARRTPYENQGSHIGGCPDWVQGAEYPHCPACQKKMMFVAQLEPNIGSLEGIFYAFVCLSCGKATTMYQQT